MSKYTELEIKAMRDLLDTASRLLGPLVDGQELPYDKSMRLKPRDTDRAAADHEMQTDVESADLTQPHGVFGTAYGRMQEDQRIRRDANVLRVSHKRLMRGCLETVFRSTLKLRKEIDGNA